MQIGSVKGYKLYIISKRRAGREDFIDFVGSITDDGNIMEDIRDAIENRGRVYGIYKDKKITGIYVFNRIRDYFIANAGENVEIAGIKFDFEKFWDGESKDAYKLTHTFVLADANEHMEKLHEFLKADLRDQIDFGQIAGVQWNDTLLYRKNLKKDKSSSSAYGWIMGFLIGMVIGGICFDNIALGLCFGMSYAMLWGGVSAASASKTEWRTFDFINPEVVKEE